MILILGGNGFAGQHVAHELLSRGERVAVTMNNRRTVPVLLKDHIEAGRAEAVPLDITDSFAFMETVGRLRPRIIIDLSGYHPKQLSPSRDVTVRTAALLNLLESARIYGAERVVLMSSMDVYWGIDGANCPFREEDPVPLLENDDHFIVQSWVKKSLEVIGNLYRRQHGMDIAFVRASGIYGPLYRTYLNVPSRLARAAALGQTSLDNAFEAIVAEGGYDQVHVKDMARGIALVALAGKLQHAAYNIGAGRAPTYGEFAAATRAAVPGFDLTLPERAAGAAPGPMDGRWMSIERARAELGYAPEWTLEAAMADYVDWIRRTEG